MNPAEELLQSAKQARENAHVPYSKFKVGSALKLRNSEQIFSGCNIENISFGATICAERVAIFKALSENPDTQLKEILLVTDSESYDVPCGMCLQVMSEFASPDLPIHLANLHGLQRTVKLSDLMPFQFDNESVRV